MIWAFISAVCSHFYELTSEALNKLHEENDPEMIEEEKFYNELVFAAAHIMF